MLLLLMLLMMIIMHTAVLDYDDNATEHEKRGDKCLTHTRL